MKMMHRDLTEAEHAVCEALIRYGISAETPITDERREEWLALLSNTSVCRECGCGICPSVELVYQGQPVPTGRDRCVLEATIASNGALVLLFIDDGLLSYLEVCPVEDEYVPMPTAADLSFE